MHWNGERWDYHAIMDVTRDLHFLACHMAVLTVYGRHFDGVIQGLPSHNHPVNCIP